ncbi:STAS domain-containing protein [bacterium]|nr:STAS domain-containing protein [bacterium]
MKINVETKNNAVILHCKGSLDANTVADFKKETTKLLDGGNVKIIIDGKELDFVDSMGLGSLISLLRKTKQHDGDVLVVNLTSDVRTIFEITRLHKLFKVFDDLDQACGEFKKQ